MTNNFIMIGNIKINLINEKEILNQIEDSLKNKRKLNIGYVEMTDFLTFFLFKSKRKLVDQLDLIYFSNPIFYYCIKQKRLNFKRVSSNRLFIDLVALGIQKSYSMLFLGLVEKEQINLTHRLNVLLEGTKKFIFLNRDKLKNNFSSCLTFIEKIQANISFIDKSISNKNALKILKENQQIIVFSNNALKIYSQKKHLLNKENNIILYLLHQIFTKPWRLLFLPYYFFFITFLVLFKHSK